ncbi:MAG: phosphatase PAP2 family protein [Lactobacillaceae bacterium]|nr:phosphatase PAP2 family protein [Lactobacillaceae bacterium]
MVVRLADYLKRVGLISGAIFIVLFIVVAVRLTPIMNMDTAITAAFGKWNFTFGDIFMNTISFLGSTVATLIYAAIGFALLYISGLRIPALWVALTYGSGMGVAFVIKQIVSRARPLGHISDGFSFPSGHALGTFMIITMAFIIVIPNLPTLKMQSWMGFGLITLGLLVMESRLYLQDHYLTDVVAGASFGIAWVVLTTWLYDKYADVLRQRFAFFEYDEI